MSWSSRLKEALANKDLTSATNIFPTFNQSTTGTAAGIAGNPFGVSVSKLDHRLSLPNAYALLATLPIDDSANVGSVTITGRIGGWTPDTATAWSIILLNRSSAFDGNHVYSSVIASEVAPGGAFLGLAAVVDLVAYKQADKSARVYLKFIADGLYAYDFVAKAFQGASVGYDGTVSTSTPAGTLIWSLSTAPRLELDVNGAVKAGKYATGSRPSASASGQGAQIFDTTLNKPIWSTGSGWVDASGASV